MDWARQARWARGPRFLGPVAWARAPPGPSPSPHMKISEVFYYFFVEKCPPQKIMKKRLFGHSLKPRALGAFPVFKNAKFYSG